jgi:uncharacterized metal-binding protein YceD (DUF177 family)
MSKRRTIAHQPVAEGSAPLAWSHAIEEIGKAGFQRTREASAEERSAVARELGLIACERLVATYLLRARAGGRYELEATISAAITQACVVTLDPVPQAIEAEVAARFWPAEELAGSLDEGGLVDPTAEDEPEPIIDGMLEVGRVVYEQLAMVIDPFPRAPDAVLERTEAAGSAAATGESTTEGPFAKLSALKAKARDDAV